MNSTLNSEEAGKDMSWSDLRKAPLAVTWRTTLARGTRTEDQILYRSQIVLTVCVFQLVITDV